MNECMNENNFFLIHVIEDRSAFNEVRPLFLVWLILTLRFATRMMCVAIEPALNEHFDPTIQVKKMEKELRSLKQELAM